MRACPLWTELRTGKVSLVDQRPENHFSISELVEHWTPYVDDLLVHDPEGPGECLVRRGELITVPENLDPVATHLRRWIDSVHQDDDLSLVRVRLRVSAQHRCVDIALDTAGAVAGVAANHVHFGSPVMFGTPVMYGTGADVRDAAPVASPPEQQWDVPVTVGVLDTGLDPHPWFAARSWFEELPEVLDADDDSGQDRQAGHGTFVSGVVLQHAPGVVIRPQRVLSSLGFTDDIKVAAGLRALRRTAVERRERIDVVLMTTGCHTGDDACPPVLRAEVERCRDAVVVAAAGNQSTDRPFWPAALPTVVGVAATGGDGSVAEFSNFGDWIDAAAPGVDVVSSYVRMESGGNRARSYGFARWSGSSFAAPRVAAEVAVGLRDGLEPGTAAGIACQRYPFGR